MKKPLEIDMCAGSQLRDTQGEMLLVEGADIDDLLSGKGRLNDNHGKGFFNSIGRIISAKKIFTEEDCDNDRHKYYWEKVKSPYIYVHGVLYDDDDHQNAKAAAAILRNIYKTDSPLKIKASVEGGTISRGIKDPSLLARTKIHSVALTFVPANQATLVEPLNLDKSLCDEKADIELIRSVMHMAQDNVPSFRHIVRKNSAKKVHENLHKISELMKIIRGEKSEINIPSSKTILELAIEAKIDNNINRIYDIVANVANKEDDLNKGIKHTLTSAALVSALASSPTMDIQSTYGGDKQPVASHKIESPHKDVNVTHANIIDKLRFSHPNLWALAQVESAGGKDLNHVTLKNGMHKGMTAGGPWGMMPKTAAYVLKVSPGLQNKYPNLTTRAKNVDKYHAYFTDAMNKNPSMAYDFAKTLYNHLDTIHSNDVNRIAYSWHHGIGGTQQALKNKKNVNNNFYVHRFHNALKGLEKSLTAGYGDAGAPTSRVQGSVLQSEALESKKNDSKGFKYATCKNCGKEQIYMKHQIKCRDCGKTWSLNDLLKLMYQ